MPEWVLPIVMFALLAALFYSLYRMSKKHGWGYFTMNYPENSEEPIHTIKNIYITFGKFRDSTEEKHVRIDISKAGITFSREVVLFNTGKNGFTIPRHDVIDTKYQQTPFSQKYTLNIKNEKRIVIYGKAAGMAHQYLKKN